MSILPLVFLLANVLVQISETNATKYVKFSFVTGDVIIAPTEGKSKENEEDTLGIWKIPSQEVHKWASNGVHSIMNTHELHETLKEVVLPDSGTEEINTSFLFATAEPEVEIDIVKHRSQMRYDWKEEYATNFLEYNDGDLRVGSVDSKTITCYLGYIEESENSPPILNNVGKFLLLNPENEDYSDKFDELESKFDRLEIALLMKSAIEKNYHEILSGKFKGRPCITVADEVLENDFRWRLVTDVEILESHEDQMSLKLKVVPTEQTVLQFHLPGDDPVTIGYYQGSVFLHNYTSEICVVTTEDFIRDGGDDDDVIKLSNSNFEQNMPIEIYLKNNEVIEGYAWSVVFIDSEPEIFGDFMIVKIRQN